MRKKRYHSNDIRIAVSTTSVNFGNFIWALVKLGLGIFTPNYFLVASALFTLGIVNTRRICLKGLKINNREKDRKYMGRASLFLTLSGLLYMIYSLRLLFKPTSAPIHFGFIPSIILTAVSIMMLVLAIKGIKNVQRNNRYYHILKDIDLISAFIDIMITQMALLSYLKADLPVSINTYLSLFIGGLAIILGGYNFIRSRYERKRKNKRKINIAAKEGLKITLGSDNEKWITFNENLSIGKTKGRLFGERFNKLRAEGYGISLKEYKERNEEFFDFLYHLDRYDVIQLWFGNASTSRINYKAIIDCLRERNYNGQVILNIVDEYYGDVYSSNEIII